MIGCTGDDDPAVTDDANVVKVSVAGNNGNNFSPAQVRIKVGQTVRWTWMGGGASHNVVSGANCTTDDKFRSPGGPTGQIGTTFDRKFDVAGTFPYYCEPHCDMGMKGEVIVE